MNTNWEPGARARAEGQAKGWGLENTNTQFVQINMLYINYDINIISFNRHY